MHRSIARLAAAGFAASALTLGALGATGPSYAATPAHAHTTVARDVTCAEATAHLQKAQKKLKASLKQLAAAKKKLHQAHAHGSAGQFQQAKDRVKRVKVQVQKHKDAVGTAQGEIAGVCPPA